MSKLNLFLIGLCVFALVIFGGCGKGGSQKTSTSVTSRSQEKSAGEGQSELASEVTAREAVNQLTSKAQSWASDARPYKLEGGERGLQAPAISGGKCSKWRVWFSSPSKKEIYVFSFEKGKLSSYPEGGGGGFTYQVSDWTESWKLDSDEAVKIANQGGIKEVTMIKLYLANGPFVFKPGEVPENCVVFWDVYGRDASNQGKGLYIDATNGKVYERKW